MRDYRKNTVRRSHNSANFPGWLGLVVGLAIGLSVAVGVWLHKPKAPVEAIVAQPKKAAPQSARDESNEQQNQNATEYTFYNRLKNFEVIIPEKEKDVHRDIRPAPETRPGAYILQAGSFKSVSEADQRRAKLALIGVESKIQQVTLDTETWQRVRIGPISNLDDLNRIRTRLRQADVDALVIRVGD
jgi:cell division protein FtsN